VFWRISVWEFFGGDEVREGWLSSGMSYKS
jgi:hypothetical protein